MSPAPAYDGAAPVHRRVAAIEALGAADALDDHAPLSRALEDTEAGVRKAALEAIGQLAFRSAARFDEAMFERVALRARDGDERVRAECAVALVLLEERSDRTVGILAQLIDDTSPRVRREAAAALGDTSSSKARTPLLRHIGDEDGETQFEVAFALASLGDASGLEILVHGLSYGRRRLDACEGLRRLGSPEAIPALEALVMKWSLGWPERLTAWGTLYALGRAEAAKPILERTRAFSREERRLALGMIGTHRIAEGREELERVANDPRDRLRCTAIRALGELGDPAAAPVLSAIAAALGDEEAREDARAALERLGG